MPLLPIYNYLLLIKLISYVKKIIKYIKLNSTNAYNFRQHLETSCIRQQQHPRKKEVILPPPLAIREIITYNLCSENLRICLFACLEGRALKHVIPGGPPLAKRPDFHFFPYSATARVTRLKYNFQS